MIAMYCPMVLLLLFAAAEASQSTCSRPLTWFAGQSYEQCVVPLSYPRPCGPLLRQITDDGWHLWKIAHEKTYQHLQEEHDRYAVWQDNFNKIRQHNTNFKMGTSAHSLRMNHLGDMSQEEYRQRNGLLRVNHMNRTTTGSTFIPAAHLHLPKSVDWRKHGYVTPVKNQGHCGSCWTFSTTGALEGQHFKKSGRLVSLSEQNLVDCSSKNNGCNGGLMDFAFQYIKDNGGIDTEDEYPYTGQEGECKFKKSKLGVTDSGFVDVTRGCEKALKMAVATVGPISVAIDASHFSFQFFHEGVYDELSCSSEELDHGVLLVGYGTHQGQDYWLVKNSWGPHWGIEGFIRMARNKGNQCGIATSASYPLV